MKKVFLVLTVLSLFGFIIPSEQKVLNKQNLWQAILKADIKFPDIVYAQALLETGTFASTNCKVNNNLFGMNVPKKRKTVAKKSNGRYAKYNHWTQSVLDYKLYQDYLFAKKNYTRSQYLYLLDTKYCESSGYTAKLHKIIKSNQHILKISYEDLSEIRNTQD